MCVFEFKYILCGAFMISYIWNKVLHSDRLISMDNGITTSDEIMAYLVLLEEIDEKAQHKRTLQDEQGLNIVYSEPISSVHS